MRKVRFRAIIEGEAIITDEEAENIESVDLSCELQDLHSAIDSVEKIEMLPETTEILDEDEEAKIQYDAVYDNDRYFLSQSAYEEAVGESEEDCEEDDED